GKWILPLEYVFDSVKHGRWLNEQSYRWDSSVTKDWSLHELQILNSAKCWRQKLASSKMPGAFQGWKVVLLIEDDEHRKMFERVLKAGNAVVYQQISASSEITHVFQKKVEIDKEHMKALNVPCYSVSYIGEYLHGKEIAESQAHKLDCDENCLDQSQCSTVNSEIDILTDFDIGDKECSKLENTLKDEICAPQVRAQQKDCLEVIPHQARYRTACFSQGSIHRIVYLLADALFTEALEELRYSLSAGGLPPVALIHSLMKHALEGDAGPVFSPMFMSILLEILHHNPPCRIPLRVSYFLDILQCPDCKKGTWSLLEMAIRFCIDGGPFCHHLPGPVQPGLTEFLVELLRYFLRLIEYDLHALNSTNSRDWKGANPTVLVKIFWSVWEKSKLTTYPIERLTEFVVAATKWLNASKEAAKMELVYILHAILGVVVEYWIRANLNWHLTEKGVKDLAEYLVMLCEDFSFMDLETLITYQQSPWLNMFTADAIYRKFCLQNSIAFHPEPLSLFKIVSSYVTALGRLSSSGPSRARNPGGKKMGPWPGIEPHTPEFTTSDDSQSPANVLPNLPAFKKSLGGSKFLPSYKNILKGLQKVNLAGETVLHRACKRNQAERLISALQVPGVDINVKDHAGWTPLHEACNHGSIECVRAILQHCPDVDLLTQVDGVSPLHDALSVGELDIAKLLLSQGGKHPVLPTSGHNAFLCNTFKQSSTE
ncbi:SLF1 protein, partial [Polyodon spathula]|nr:SLF1 protein [Polyodon spathula]